MQILRFDELDSTNAYAKRNCSLLTDKTVVIAQTQTAGRGRMDRKWLSQPGGLYFSVLLKPRKTDFLANLTQLMALCVCRAARALGANAWLKWPNDVLADGKKLCGILSEAVTSGRGVEGIVVGAGVNVNQTDLSRAGQPAVSLKDLGINADEERVLQAVTDLFFDDYDNVLEHGFEVIRAAYLEHFPYVGQEVQIQHCAAPVRGRVQTVSPEGRLMLKTPQGLMEISIGDMTV